MWVAVPPILRQGLTLAQSLPGYARNLEGLWRGLGERVTWLPPPSHVTQWVAAHLAGYVQGLLGVTGHVLSLGIATFTVVFLLVNILQDGPHLRDQLLQLVPPYRREAVHGFLELLDERVGRYTLGTICDFTIVGMLVAAGLALIGVPNALALGAIVGVFDILPYIGATIGAIPGLIVAFGISPRLGVEALVVYVVIQQLEGLVIYPNVVGRAVHLHPIWVLLALTVGMKTWGLAGAFLGIPAALVVKTTMEVWVVPAVAAMRPPASPPEVTVTFVPEPEIPRETPPAQ
jgi:predicted PurR-regulated permease PerM